MTSYQQLTQDQRYQIHAFLKAGFSQPRIARELGVDRSTIWRELKRNRGQRGYRPKQAHQLADSRRQAKANATRISAATSAEVAPAAATTGSGIITSDARIRLSR